MIGFYNYTVYLTYLGLVSAVLGIYAVFSGNPLAALFFMLFAGFCDMFDGMVARTKKDRTRQEKDFGIQIDSLCDVISFGVLPAVMGHVLDISGLWYALAGSFFVLCGVIRLAYYNVTEEERQHSSDGKRSYYLGMPITMSALVMSFAFGCCIFFDSAAQWIYPIALFLCAMLFITPIKFRKPGIAGLVVMILCGIAILGSILFLAMAL